MKIEMSPKKVKVEIPNYGEFEVSPLGAGAEAEIRVIGRKISELQAETKKYDDLVDRETKGEELDKESPEYKEAIGAYKAVAEAFDELRDTVYEKMRAVFKGKNIEKLFNDFTYDQILEIHTKATKDNE